MGAGGVAGELTVVRLRHLCPSGPGHSGKSTGVGEGDGDKFKGTPALAQSRKQTY